MCVRQLAEDGALGPLLILQGSWVASLWGGNRALSTVALGATVNSTVALRTTVQRALYGWHIKVPAVLRVLTSTPGTLLSSTRVPYE